MALTKRLVCFLSCQRELKMEISGKTELRLKWWIEEACPTQLKFKELIVKKILLSYKLNWTWINIWKKAVYLQGLGVLPHSVLQCFLTIMIYSSMWYIIPMIQVYGCCIPWGELTPFYLMKDGLVYNSDECIRFAEHQKFLCWMSYTNYKLRYFIQLVDKTRAFQTTYKWTKTKPITFHMPFFPLLFWLVFG